MKLGERVGGWAWNGVGQRVLEAMSISLEGAAQAYRDAMGEAVKRFSLWYLIEGVLQNRQRHSTGHQPDWRPPCTTFLAPTHSRHPGRAHRFALPARPCTGDADHLADDPTL